jgi:phosphatidylglycerol:prolipoprotein diacylglycerol transferase
MHWHEDTGMTFAPIFAALPYPEIDPIIFQIGPLALRWYALAYVAGLVLGWRYMLRINARASLMSAETVDDFLVWCTLGVILGGRLGYVLFYNLPYYAENPLQALMVWQGGMSFHGGVLGVAVAEILFARRRGIALLNLTDLVACAAPVGLFFGRFANFINGELFGRASDVPWAMVFPHGGPAPRHPSQLYEAALEGAVLFLLLYWLIRKFGALARPGLSTGVFLVGYALSRMFVELFRQPDAHIGTLTAGSTMGQWLSLPMILGGIFLIWYAMRSSSAGRT